MSSRLFSHSSQVLRQLRELAPELPAIVFLSLSKSVSRGVTTAGCLVANHTAAAAALLRDASAYATALDTSARPAT